MYDLTPAQHRAGWYAMSKAKAKRDDRERLVLPVWTFVRTSFDSKAEVEIPPLMSDLEKVLEKHGLVHD